MDIQNSNNAEKLAYTVDAAADAIGVSRGMLYILFRSGDITPRKIGRRTVVARDELARYLKTLPTGVAAA